MILVSDALIAFLTKELEERDLSQRALARRAGISQTTVSEVLGGQRRITDNFCRNVARALNVPADQLLELAGLRKALPEPTQQERDLLELFQELSAGPRRTVVAMLRGLAKQPALDMTPDEEELLSICRQLDPPHRVQLLEAARVFAHNLHAGEPRVIGDDIQEERAQPVTN